MEFSLQNGWYGKENDGLRDFYWSKSTSNIVISTEVVYKYINLYIGSPRSNKVEVTNGDQLITEIYIKPGWHTYQIPFSTQLTFKSAGLELSTDTRDLAFMFSELTCTNSFIFDKDYCVIDNIKSNWIDIVYVLHSNGNDTIEIVTNVRTHSVPIFSGGHRSISLKIENEEIVDNKFKFYIKKNSDSNIEIVSIVNRDNFYDFLGLSTHADETSIINKNKTKEIVKNERLRIQWFVTWKCNMSCEYCWQESAGSVYRTIGGKTIKTAEDWAAAINRLNPCRLYLTGGEPSLYKDLPRMFSYLNPDIKLDMTSNFGKTFDLNNWSQLNPSQWNFIFFSLHPTQWANVDDFFNKLEKFFETFDSTKVGIEMVLHPKNIDLVNPDRIIEFSKKHKMVLPHLDQFVDSNVSNLKRECNSQSSKITFKPNFSNKYALVNKTSEPARQPIYCPAGWKKINIDFEGNVFTCMSAIDRSKLFHSTSLPHYSTIGNIFDENFEIKQEPVICWESYRCSACDYQDVQHAWTKFKNNFDYQLPIPE